jgi:hypothetical protein
MTNLPADYFKNNYGRCLLGEGCHCLRNLGNWLGTLCAQWEPTTATSFEELMEQARAIRSKQKEVQNGTA